MEKKRIVLEQAESTGNVNYSLNRVYHFPFTLLHSIKAAKIALAISVILLGLLLSAHKNASSVSISIGVFCAVTGAQILLEAIGVRSLILGTDSDIASGPKDKTEQIDVQDMLSYASRQLREVEYVYSSYLDQDAANRRQEFLKQILPVISNKSESISVVFIYNAIEEEFGFSANSKEADNIRYSSDRNELAYKLVDSYKIIAYVKESAMSGKVDLAQRDVARIVDLGNRLIKSAHIIRSSSYSYYR